MKIYSENNNYKLYNGNMLNMLEVIEPNSIDSIVTDPPYELGFMGKSWDKSGIAFQKETWEKCLKVLKPGGHLLAFGGSRTYHRIACAIEDAGFEIRDCIMWLYGSGFPKSLNIKSAIEKKIGKKENKFSGFGTQLKPAYEPIIVARKPVENSIVENIMKYGVGGINIDECRVESKPRKTGTKPTSDKATGTGNTFMGSSKNRQAEYDKLNLGRFPANIILTYDDTDFEEVCGGFPDTKSQVRVGEDKDIKQNTFSLGRTGITPRWHNDSSSASRYFYCAKASKKDRNEGLENCNNFHCTVKPTELMQYLIRLISPNNAIILDPFNGSGSTGKAVMYENKERNKNYKYIGIELTEEYLPISKARIEFAKQTKSNDEIQFSMFNEQALKRLETK